MVLDKLPVPGRPTILIRVGQGPIALSVGADKGCFDIFSLTYRFSFLSPSLWETARYRLKYCLKRPLSPKQPTNQPTNHPSSFKRDHISKSYRVQRCKKQFKQINKSLFSGKRWGRLLGHGRLLGQEHLLNKYGFYFYLHILNNICVKARVC